MAFRLLSRARALKNTRLQRTTRGGGWHGPEPHTNPAEHGRIGNVPHGAKFEMPGPATYALLVGLPLAFYIGWQERPNRDIYMWAREEFLDRRAKGWRFEQYKGMVPPEKQE